MSERRDLGVTLIGTTMLMLSLVYLAQCSAGTPAPGPVSETSATAQSGRVTNTARQAEPSAAEKEDDEESGRVKSIGHALQTIGADPVLRKTYGVDQ